MEKRFTLTSKVTTNRFTTSAALAPILLALNATLNTPPKVHLIVIYPYIFCAWNLQDYNSLVILGTKEIFNRIKTK